jgi:hypothetical protein
MRDGRTSYRKVEVRVTDDAHLEPTPVDATGIPALQVADRYAGKRIRSARD